jgi:hypothetical protein
MMPHTTGTVLRGVLVKRKDLAYERIVHVFKTFAYERIAQGKRLDGLAVDQKEMFEASGRVNIGIVKQVKLFGGAFKALFCRRR